MTPLPRSKILRLIPHAGAMCLLDEVLHWDEQSVHCRSQRFAAAENPLRRADGSLGMASLIEVAAQAMAVHGRLTAPAAGAPRPGYLVSLRHVSLATALVETPPPLTVAATRQLGDDQGATYDFTVQAQGTPCLSGRATVLFGTPA